ncbi:MAG: mechanosensitive ion channel protein [Haliea sp.]|uniref:mechanosensitive ion channel family protein n=1 Tax=Haliea sp. TaxID=1932666 RepID=UPI000C64B9FA|nr:mechanosensitive ion channel domain-containing protein [Haliea sp.]MBM70001.1 mechanosensitive ion channel protein [Haliea sp.]|tara:strand:- start:26365 stop:27219 length:855 start_codon:yes stop_codon:yes gene_type:complete
MEQLNRILNAPLIVFGDVAITLAQVLTVLALLVGGIFFVLWSGRFLRSRMLKRNLDPNVVQLAFRAYLILGMAIVGMSTLDLLSVPLAAFAFVSGAVAIGFGFGAQNIINNFISGWILMWERPIKIGDFLELGDVRGTVESINTRSTRIRRVDGVHLLIPNSQLLENTVTNWTLVDDLVRTAVRVGVAYDSDVRLTETLMYRVAEKHPNVLKTPEPMVIFDNFGDSSLEFELNFWVHSTAERGLRMIRSDLRFQIDALFREHGLVIAFPQRDVHLNGELRLLNS